MKRRFIIGGLLAILATLALAGCGSSNKPTEVTVSLTDYGIDSSVTTFKVGQPYHFVVTNNGAVEHELMVVQPIDPSSGMDMEAMDAMAIGHIEAADLQSGDTATLDLTFDQAYPAGTLEFSCHLEGHYEQGMHEDIVVEP